jgi:hypothetical protein
VFEIDVDGRRLVTGSEGLAGVLVERRTASARRPAPRRGATTRTARRTGAGS